MFTYSLATDLGKVRLILCDRDPGAPYFNDDEIETFLFLENASLKLAAALALETIATDEALVQKVIRTQKLETNGAATAKVLLDRAARLREQANIGDDGPSSGQDGLFLVL